MKLFSRKVQNLLIKKSDKNEDKTGEYSNKINCPWMKIFFVEFCYKKIDKKKKYIKD